MSGISVSLPADSKILAIGAIGNDANGEDAGHVKVCYREWGGTGLSRKQISHDIHGEAGGDGLGMSVSLSANDKPLAIETNNNGDYTGHVS